MYTPAEAPAVTVKFANVFAPLIVVEPELAPIKETVLKVTPDPAFIVGPLVDVQLICDVPALNERFVPIVKTIGCESLNVNVLDPSVIVLTLLLLDDKALAVTL